MKKENIDILEMKAKKQLLLDLSTINLGDLSCQGLGDLSYKELVEFKILTLRIQKNIGTLYSMVDGVYVPLDESDKIYDDVKTREFARKNIACYRELLSKSSNIQEFASQLEEEPYNDVLEESTYTGTFGMELNLLPLVDEVTALKANVMFFEGKSREEINNFVSKNNTTTYVCLESPHIDLVFGSGQQYDDGEEALLLSSLPDFIDDWSVIINLNTLCDEINNLGFETYFKRYGAKTPKEIIKSLVYSGQAYVDLVDLSLETTDENKAFMVFSRQKVM